MAQIIRNERSNGLSMGEACAFSGSLGGLEFFFLGPCASLITLAALGTTAYVVDRLTDNEEDGEEV